MPKLLDLVAIVGGPRREQGFGLVLVMMDVCVSHCRLNK